MREKTDVIANIVALLQQNSLSLIPLAEGINERRRERITDYFSQKQHKTLQVCNMVLLFSTVQFATVYSVQYRNLKSIVKLNIKKIKCIHVFKRFTLRSTMTCQFWGISLKVKAEI